MNILCGLASGPDISPINNVQSAAFSCSHTEERVLYSTTGDRKRSIGGGGWRWGMKVGYGMDGGIVTWELGWVAGGGVLYES